METIKIDTLELKGLRAGLKGANNAESKRLAEKTIRENEKSMAELTEWVSKHAKKDGNQ